MALTHFVFGQVGAHFQNAQIPAMLTSSFSSEGVASSASNQQTTATAGTDAQFIQVCRVSTDTAVYVAFGSNPNALTGTTARAYMPAGTVEYFIVPASSIAAVVTA